MRSTAPTRTARRRALWAGLRRVADNQTRLWDRMVDDLEPWRHERPLRWRGVRLEGEVLPAQRESTR